MEPCPSWVLQAAAVGSKNQEVQNREEKRTEANPTGYSSSAEEKKGERGDEEWRCNCNPSTSGREDETAAGTGMAAHTGRGEKKILGDIHREKGTEGGREIPMVDMAAKRPRSQQQERQAVQSCSPTRQEHECLPSPPSSSCCWLLLPLSHGVTVVFVCSGGRK